MEIPSKIRLDLDKWEYNSKVYDLLEYVETPNSTAVKILIMDSEGNKECLVVPSHSIYRIPHLNER